MKVFLSFSGDASHEIAVALRDWLPKVIQAVKPFISEDIGKGERWSVELAEALNETEFGIICITKYNSCTPWINFEAGAVSKAIPEAVHQSWVVPLLFKTGSTEISDPLRQFQAASADKEGLFRMLENLNSKLGEDQLTPDLLKKEFDKWWSELEAILNSITVDPPSPSPLPWLYTEDCLIDIQAEINARQIWVVTPDLYQRTLKPKVEAILRQNVERDVCYKFVTVSSSKTEEAKRDLERIFNAKPDSFKVIDYPGSTFHDVAVTDYIIINPDFDLDHAPRVFLELPIESRGYWIEVDSNAALDFVSRFRAFAEGARPSAHVTQTKDQE